MEHVQNALMDMREHLLLLADKQGDLEWDGPARQDLRDPAGISSRTIQDGEPDDDSSCPGRRNCGQQQRPAVDRAVLSPTAEAWPAGSKQLDGSECAGTSGQAIDAAHEKNLTFASSNLTP